MEGFLVGVDIGGTQVRVALARLDALDTLDMARISSTKQATAKTDPLAISRQVIEMARALIAGGNVAAGDIKAISIATAGPIDMARGELFNNSNLGFRTIPLKDPIAKAFPGIPIFIINDCNGAVLGVHCFEATPDERDNMAYVTVSTGIGGGVVSRGRLVLGKEGNAAEVGHGVIARGSGVRCNCGAEGCWEAFSSGTATGKAGRQLASQDPAAARAIIDRAGGSVDAITARDVYGAARDGDPAAKRIVDVANAHTAAGIGLINNFYDVSVIYFGGSMMKDEDLILDPVRAMLATAPVEWTINKPPVLKKCTLGDDVGLLGALALGKYTLGGNPVLS